MTLMIVPENGTKLDLLAEQYRTAFDKLNTGREQWIEGTLELAAVVLKARNLYPAHHDFSRWIERNGLRPMTKDTRAILANFARMGEHDARELLQRSTGSSWEWIWRHRPNKTETALLRTPKGRVGDISRRNREYASGSSKRLRIPTVMQDDSPEPTPKRVMRREPPPERKAVVIRGLTREQVDPDFKGTTLEFATKYGHVNLHTKGQIEHNKRQENLAAWLGAMADHERSGREMLTALAAIDPETLHEWLAKPGKAGKLQAWRKSIELAYEKLRNITGDR